MPFRNVYFFLPNRPCTLYQQLRLLLSATRRSCQFTVNLKSKRFNFFFQTESFYSPSLIGKCCIKINGLISWTSIAQLQHLLCHSWARHKPAVCFVHKCMKSIYYVGFFLLIWFFKYCVTQESSSVCVALYHLWLVCKWIMVIFRFICEPLNTLYMICLLV